jgi:hypothetical protein
MYHICAVSLSISVGGSVEVQTQASLQYKNTIFEIYAQSATSIMNTYVREISRCLLN